MNDFDVVTGPAPAKLIPPPPVAEKPRERTEPAATPLPAALADASPADKGGGATSSARS